jgi:hypothetical protein
MDRQQTPRLYRSELPCWVMGGQWANRVAEETIQVALPQH